MPDYNRDGFADVAIAGGDGHVEVYLGGPHGLAATPSQTLDGGSPSYAGGVLSGGDLNGDGFADILVTTPNTDLGSILLQIYLGGTGGMTPGPAATYRSDGRSYIPRGTIGDVNGDGYADFLGDGPSGREGGFGTSVAVLPGGPAGIATTPLQVLCVGSEWFGGTFWPVGDVNGDGYADVALTSTGTGLLIGYATLTVLPGGAGGFGSGHPIGLGDTGHMSDVALSVTGPGDLNGDGYADFAVTRSTDGPTGSAASVLFFPGNAAGITAAPTVPFLEAGDAGTGFRAVVMAGDVDGDGFEDLVVDAMPGLRVHPGSAAGPSPSRYTGFAVPGASGTQYTYTPGRDLDGDGFSDLVISLQQPFSMSPPYTRTGPGAASIFPGSRIGLDAVPSMTLRSPRPSDGEFGDSLAWRERPRRGRCRGALGCV